VRAVSDTARCQVAVRDTSSRDAAVPYTCAERATPTTKPLLEDLWSNRHELDTAFALTENGV